MINPVNAAWFHPTFARQTLLDHFQVANLTAFGLEEQTAASRPARPPARCCATSALTLRRPDQVTSLRFSARGDRLVLDEETLRNLEIFRTFRGETGPGTLIHHVDGTVTSMGRRLLARRLAEALTDLDELARLARRGGRPLEDRALARGSARASCGRRRRPGAPGRPRGHRPHRTGGAAPAGRRALAALAGLAATAPDDRTRTIRSRGWLAADADFGDLAAASC